jgi:hypothetical protein
MGIDDRQRLTQTLSALEEATLATIQLFLEYGPTAERGLRDHVERVAHLSVNVAGLCELREPNVSIIECAALLHHVPLFPAGGARGRSRENDSAFTLDVLRALPAFTASIKVITALPRAHEPNPSDGRHTPLFVPFGARIIAICDRADELMHREPYPLTANQAADVILRDRVTRYHPEAVDALCTLLRGFRPTPGGTGREPLPRVRRTA